MPEKKYTIKKGDSLWGIANHNGLTLQELMDINGITDSKYHLEPGAELFITKRSTMEQVPQQSDSLFGRLFKTNSTAPESQPSWTPTGTQGSIKGRTAQQYNKQTGEWEKTTQCARWANDALRQYEGQYDDKHVKGDAWTRLKQGKMLYSGYTDKYDINDFSEQASDLRNHTAADNLKSNFDFNNLDPSKVYMVNMYYDKSHAKEQAWKEGTAGTTGTHTGNLYYDTKSKSWKVAHNLYGTVINDDFSRLLGSNTGKGYGITAIAEAKARNNGSGLFNRFQGKLYDMGIMESGGKIIKSITGNTSKGSPFVEGPRKSGVSQTFSNIGDFFGNIGSHLKSSFASKSYLPQLKEGDDYRNSIVVRKSNHNLYYYDKDGNLVFQTKVSTGANSGQKQKVGDSRTPVGKFSIISFEQNRDPKVFGANKFYRLNTGEWTGIGIHGDANRPEQIGRNASHGCVRLSNDKLKELTQILGNNYRKNVHILDENDEYKDGGKIVSNLKYGDRILSTTSDIEPSVITAIPSNSVKPTNKNANSFVDGLNSFRTQAMSDFNLTDDEYSNLMSFAVNIANRESGFGDNFSYWGKNMLPDWAKVAGKTIKRGSSAINSNLSRGLTNIKYSKDIVDYPMLQNLYNKYGITEDGLKNDPEQMAKATIIRSIFGRNMLMYDNFNKSYTYKDGTTIPDDTALAIWWNTGKLTNNLNSNPNLSPVPKNSASAYAKSYEQSKLIE